MATILIANGSRVTYTYECPESLHDHSGFSHHYHDGSPRVGVVLDYCPTFDRYKIQPNDKRRSPVWVGAQFVHTVQEPSP